MKKFFPKFSHSLDSIPRNQFLGEKKDYREFNLKRFLNIAEGCSFNCSFCTHKPGLGERRSRPLDDIIKQAKECIDSGAEISESYGHGNLFCGGLNLAHHILNYLMKY